MSDTVSFIKFKKIKDIGEEGKNSNVFLAKDEQLGDDLVVKEMDKTKFKPDEYFLESKMIYASKHPNIVDIQYASQNDDFLYLAMPYYENGSLNKLASQRFLTIREIIKCSLELLNGVSYIHSKGMLHLDIKPTNILMDRAGRAVLTDFGLSKYVDENGVADQAFNYTLHADPEWFSHSARTVQSDIYQVGLTLYRLCNGIDILSRQLKDKGIKTLDELSEVIKRGEFPDRHFFLPHVPAKLRNIIKKALQVDIDKRYSNTIELMNEIGQVSNNLDWVFTTNSNIPYILESDKYTYTIKVDRPSNDIICTRTNKNTLKSNKITRYCYNGLKNEADISKKIIHIVGDLS